MRQLTASLCLILLVFLGSVGKSFALPQCPSWGVFHNCFGTYTWSNGDKYVGEWRDNLFHGQGTYTSTNGDKYVGEYRDSKKHGQGTYTYADGRVEEGAWGNNKFLYAKKLTPTVTENPDKLFTAASGSGFAVSSSGHVITNNHVIEGCDTVKIHHQGKTSKAIIITYDSINDLALLKGEFKPSTVLPLSRDNPQLLQEIYVAGFPFGKSISSSIKVTKGIVSSLVGLENNVSNIQIDAALQPGNSAKVLLHY